MSLMAVSVQEMVEVGVRTMMVVAWCHFGAGWFLNV